MGWTTMAWADWCNWVQGKTVKTTVERYDAAYRELPRGSMATLVEFTDGSKTLVLSNSEPDWSEVTPGEGVQPPTVMVWK